MARVRLISFDAASAAGRADDLRDRGHGVTAGGIDRYGIRVVARQPPDVFVIDAASDPDQCRRVVKALAKARRLRAVPVICVGASGEQRALLSLAHPNAVFTTWPALDAAVTTATE